MTATPHIAAVFVGRPKTMTDAQGSWTSSIYRDPAPSPVRVEAGGLAGDKVTQEYHGGPDAAVCAHLWDHYRYWNERHGMELSAGYVGENVTLDGLTEDRVCAGDVVRAGTALLQVSGPRVPCSTLARRIGRPDWVRLTLQAERTGFYLRVLEPGVIAPGDAWTLLERPNPEGTIPALNRCAFLDFDPDLAERMQAMEGLADWWKELVREKAEAAGTHWSDEKAR